MKVKELSNGKLIKEEVLILNLHLSLELLQMI